VIREKRTNLATKNNLMGPAGKLGTILQAFGHSITRQGSGLVDTSYLGDAYGDDVYAEYETTASGQAGPLAYRDELLDFNDDNVYNEGLMFDGLSRGMHLEIVYWHATNEIKVSYRGFPVYHEIAGELERYAPFPEWEGLVERLHRAAKDKVKNIKVVEEAEAAERFGRRKENFWQQMRMKWGI
jgi:hypothetical protein